MVGMEMREDDRRDLMDTQVLEAPADLGWLGADVHHEGHAVGNAQNSGITLSHIAKDDLPTVRGHPTTRAGTSTAPTSPTTQHAAKGRRHAS